ncbi:cytochrome c oxidase subunit II [Methylobacterium sp. E-041]|uniref:cytochrome c oxidase subunit II n=1 Tax=unclassified Methylobacterium TaxID=2615210 RepID=UPI0011C82C34|nr:MULTISPECIES: cytochrome c oxidase subunit II [unclassified Methylobacterium]MCJ2007840.1 cytochrome c oxidase subunit II [Methylobacterium sp. J-092]MCJ2040026.1 cytochrome c oxidase subunit II [Methylobacterium sp. J-059]MCJ2074700.1 cytochrome c oxidase subunit II [Methylobacterium sp. E-016]MCJ2104388.1 cytochrome c oxidase subunit II [Methylobacterium sp. E-041]MCJ2112125.1 cytochrome c oxidase subunit II [Methylobacterium sp. E-025]
MRTAQTKHRSMRGLAAFGALLLTSSQALAAGIGQPEPWQMDRQVPVTENARDILQFESWVHWLSLAICVFVLGLILWCIYRFSEKRNPTPSKTTHNTLIEVAWTIVPVLILVAVAIPSFRLLRVQLSDPKSDVMIKVTGHAWYWSYEYPADQGGGFSFDANIDEDKQPRLLQTDNEMVVPVNKIVKIQVTAADVMHSWAMPSFGFKIDAVPGRLNQFWFKADREGTYHGQCSELCGQRHAYMPIVVRVVNDEAYAAWLGEAKTKYARIDDGSKLADAR